MSGQQIIDEAMREIEETIWMDSEIKALEQIEHALIEAEIAEIAALKNQLEQMAC